MQGDSQVPNQIAVSATAFEGPITYANLHTFCQQITHTYQQQKTQWAARAARQQQQQQPARKDKQQKDEEDHASHDEL